jgi:hypothetical protein
MPDGKIYMRMINARNISEDGQAESRFSLNAKEGVIDDTV